MRLDMQVCCKYRFQSMFCTICQLKKRTPDNPMETRKDNQEHILLANTLLAYIQGLHIQGLHISGGTLCLDSTVQTNMCNVHNNNSKDNTPLHILVANTLLANTLLANIQGLHMNPFSIQLRTPLFRRLFSSMPLSQCRQPAPQCSQTEQLRPQLWLRRF